MYKRQDLDLDLNFEDLTVSLVYMCGRSTVLEEFISSVAIIIVAATAAYLELQLPR